MLIFVISVRFNAVNGNTLYLFYLSGLCCTAYIILYQMKLCVFVTSNLTAKNHSNVDVVRLSTTPKTQRQTYRTQK